MSGTETSDGSTRQSAAFWEHQWLWWDRLGPPLRPSSEDVTLLEQMLEEERAKRARPLGAVMLGVTPEIASMRWPAGTRLLAVDRSQGMIDHVWPSQPFAGAEVVRGDWTELPLAAGACDVVVADACFSQVGFPLGYERLARELARVLAPGGVFVMRAFVQLEPPESLVRILPADGEVRDVHRLAEALPKEPAELLCPVHLRACRAAEVIRGSANLRDGIPIRDDAHGLAGPEALDAPLEHGHNRGGKIL